MLWDERAELNCHLPPGGYRALQAVLGVAETEKGVETYLRSIMSVSRRRFITVSSAAIAAMPLERVWANQTQAPPTTRFETIRRNVGYFTARGGTIGWLVNKDAVFVIDSQYPDTAALFLAALEQKSPRGIDLLFNTHHHADHTGGNGILKPKTKKIVAQTKVPDLQKQAAAQQAQTQPNAPQTPQVVADATFDKTWGADAGDEKMTARHYGPGHTGGDAIVHFEHAHIVHMGDLLWNEIHPFTDRPFGASIQNWIKTIETVSKAMPADTTYIAGHARPSQPVAVDRAGAAPAARLLRRRPDLRPKGDRRR